MTEPLKCEHCCLDKHPDICDKSEDEKMCNSHWSTRQLKLMEQRKSTADFKYNVVSDKINALVKKWEL